MLGEHNCLILTSLFVPKLRYSAQARKYKPLLHLQNHSSVTILKRFVYTCRWQMNIIAEFLHPSMI